jgi:hypothetical protein
LRNTITFSENYKPKLYDQITFDLYNFGQIFINFNGVDLPIDYDPGDMIVIQDLFGGWDTYTYDKYAYDKSTSYKDIYAQRTGTDEIVLASINVYLYDYAIVDGLVQISSSNNKTLYGMIHRVLDTSNRIYYMFEFLKTPASGDKIDISILQYSTYNTLANTAISDTIKFLTIQREQDESSTRVMDALYVDDAMYFDFITYDDSIESIRAINKIIISHPLEETLQDKLKVYDDAGMEVLDFTAQYELNKTRILFNNTGMYTVKMKSKD